MKDEIMAVVGKVARLRNLDPAAVRSRNRAQPLAYSRFIVYLYCSDILQISPNEIAKAMMLDHTTVLHGINRARKLMSSASWRKTWDALITAGVKDGQKT